MRTKKQSGSTANNSAQCAEWTDPDDAPALTAAMLDRAEIFEGDVFIRRARGRPKSPHAKEQISVRLDPDLLAKLREAGSGWQTQINGLLRDAIGLDTPPRAVVKAAE